MEKGGVGVIRGKLWREARLQTSDLADMKNKHSVVHSGGSWRVLRNGKQISVHRARRDAIDSVRHKGDTVADKLITHGSVGWIKPQDMYILASRNIKESVGTPSVSRAKIATVARDAIRHGIHSGPEWSIKPSGPHVSARTKTMAHRKASPRSVKRRMR